jgi:hypothetical protein
LCFYVASLWRVLFSQDFFYKKNLLRFVCVWQADLFLDTPLVNAHTSATDVLWAGVPMLTMPRFSLVDYKIV